MRTELEAGFREKGRSMKRILIVCMTLVFMASCASAAVIPAQGIDAGFLAFTGRETRRAVVLCESLSVCDARDGKVIDTLRFGDTLMTGQSWDGWAEAAYSDGSKSGWVRSDYIVIDPAYYRTDSQTAVYAYADTMAPRVGLLDGGVMLPIIADQGDWLVVSLRGASGWIKRTPADTADQTWFKPEMLKELWQADLIINGKRTVLHGEEKKKQLVSLLASADDLGDQVAGYPFGAELVLTLNEPNSAKQVTLELATDSCCIYRVDGRDYQYARSLKQRTAARTIR